jgi:DNA-binding FadR family transcriptional regulator
MIAENLRQRILSGELAPGTRLPKQQELLVEFGVGKPSIREALQILEAEGLVTVRRGNVGGAVVHPPPVDSAARTLGLVLESRSVGLRDLSIALQRIEPVCAALCAERADRLTTVVPRLADIHEQTRTAVDQLQLTRMARRFHEAFVRHCGNETLVAVVGALESLWSSREEAWAQTAPAEPAFTNTEYRNRSLHAHQEILNLIEAGDADAVAAVTREHMASTFFYSISQEDLRTVRAGSLRPSQRDAVSSGWPD